MSYATRQSMIDQYGERAIMRLTDRTGADVIDDVRLQSALDDAAAEVNGWISKRVTLPLSPVPRALEQRTRVIAYYLLFDLRGATAEAEKRYDTAIAWLKAVARGEVSLGDETPEDGTDSSPGAISTDAPARQFTRDTMRGW